MTCRGHCLVLTCLSLHFLALLKPSKAILKVMPPKRDGHNERIYDSPWYVHRPIMPTRRALPMPHPPSHPPPRLVLGSLNSTTGRSGYGSELVAVNKATVPSSPPVAPSSTRSTHSTSAAGVTSKSSSSAAAPPPLQLASATVKDHGSRLHAHRSC